MKDLKYFLNDADVVDNTILPSERVGINGYKPRTLDEIRESVLTDIKSIEPELADLPNSLVDNLVNVGCILLKQNESLVRYLFNGISLNSVCDEFFDVVAQDYNMTRHPDSKAYVDIKVTGTPGYIIASNTKFKNTDNKVNFYNTKAVVINSLGEAIFTALSDNSNEDIKLINIGDINSPVIPDDNIKTVSNINVPTLMKEFESLYSFKERVQQRIRTPIQGSRESLLSALTSIKGVDPRQINVIVGEQKIKNVTYNSIEAIVGGGDNADIATILHKYSSLNPRVLVSNPSKNENERTVTQSLQQSGSSFNIVFTRPKILKLELTLKPKFTGIVTNNQQIETATQAAFEELFGTISIQEKINKTLILQTFINKIKDYGYTDSNIVSVDFDYKVDTKTGSLDGNGFMTEQEKDTLFQLVKYSVLIQA